VVQIGRNHYITNINIIIRTAALNLLPANHSRSHAHFRARRRRNFARSLTVSDQGDYDVCACVVVFMTFAALLLHCLSCSGLFQTEIDFRPEESDNQAVSCANHTTMTRKTLWASADLGAIAAYNKRQKMVWPTDDTNRHQFPSIKRIPFGFCQKNTN
jgi:hypothetical protein